MRSFWVVSLGVSLVVVAACGGKSEDGDSGGDRRTGGTGGTSGRGGSGATSVVPENWGAACVRSAEVTCGKWAECAPYLLELALPRDCRGYIEGACGDFARLTDISVTPGTYIACVEAFARESCDDWLYNGVTPPECEGFVGTRPIGSPCGSSNQCASGVCSADVGCGVCEAAPAEGEGCPEGRCAPGLVCDLNSGCARPKRIGDPCSVDSPCNGVLACRNGFCDRPPGNGEPCGTEEFSCDFLQGLTCGDTSLCEPWSQPGVGEACFGPCAAGAVCDASERCTPALAEGASCPPDQTIDFCDRGLECIDGTCARFDPTTCG